MGGAYLSLYIGDTLLYHMSMTFSSDYRERNMAGTIGGTLRTTMYMYVPLLRSIINLVFLAIIVININYTLRCSPLFGGLILGVACLLLAPPSLLEDGDCRNQGSHSSYSAHYPTCFVSSPICPPIWLP